MIIEELSPKFDIIKYCLNKGYGKLENAPIKNDK